MSHTALTREKILSSPKEIHDEVLSCVVAAAMADSGRGRHVEKL